MRIEQPEYRCDNCEKARTRDVNHWYCLYGAVGPPESKKLSVVTWDEKLASDCPAHACGEACMIKLAQRFFATGSFEKPKAPEPKESEVVS